MRIWIAPDDSADRLDAEEVTATVHHEYKIEGDPGLGFPHYVWTTRDEAQARAFMAKRIAPQAIGWDVPPTLTMRTVITTAWEPAS